VTVTDQIITFYSSLPFLLTLFSFPGRNITALVSLPEALLTFVFLHQIGQDMVSSLVPRSAKRTHKGTGRLTELEDRKILVYQKI
jgi:hypothetical protein